VAAGATAPDLTVTVPVTDFYPSGSRYVTLTTTVESPSDGVTQNNSASAQLPVNGSGLTVDLAVVLMGLDPLAAGQETTYVVRVLNSGSASSSGEVAVQLQSPFPGAVASGAGWSCTSALVCSNPGPVDAGGQLPDITVTATSPANVANSLYASAQVSNTSDANPNNNSSTAGSNAGGVPVDLAVVILGLDPLAAGQETTYTARVLNSGSTASSGEVAVQLQSPFPGAVASGEGWSCTTALVCSNPGPVDAGGQLADITVTATSPANVANSLYASAQVSNTSDANPNNNYSTAGSNAGGVPVDLAVVVMGLNPLAAGQETTYTARVLNSGSTASSGEVAVQLQSPFPGAVASGDGWSCTTALACSNPGPVPPGGQLADITVSATSPAVDGANSLYASAQVSNTSDANPNNNYSTAGSNAGGVPVDLAVVILGLDPLAAGQETTYTARVLNSGSTASSGEVAVQLQSPFPGAVASGEGWSCTTALVCSNPGPVPPGGQLADITVTVPVPVGSQPGTTSMSASLTSAADTNRGNNYSYVSLPLTAPFVVGDAGSAYFDVEALDSQTWPGGVERFEARFIGISPAADQAALLDVTLPPGLSYRAGSVDPGPFGEPTVLSDGLTLRWAIVMPPEGTSRSLQFAADIGPATPEGALSAESKLSIGGLDISQADSATFRVVVPTLNTVAPSTVGQGESVTVSFTGSLLQKSFSYQLVRDQISLSGSEVQGGNRQVDVIFDTSSASAGLYDAVVAVAPGIALQISGAVTIVEDSEVDLSVDLTGPSRVRLNAPGRYYATVTNNGNVDLFNVPLLITTPSDVTVKSVAPDAKVTMAGAIDAMTSSSPGLGLLSPEQASATKGDIQNYELSPTKDPSKSQQYVLAVAPRIPAHQSATAVIDITPKVRTDGNIQASVPVDSAFAASTGQVSDVYRRVYQPMTGKTEKIFGQEVDCSGEFADFCATSKMYERGLDNASRVAKNYGCVSFAPLTLGLIGNDCQFNNPFAFNPIDIGKSLLLRKFPSLKPLDKLVGIFGFVKGLYDDLFGAANEISKEQDGVAFGVAAVDPNDKIGPGGSGAERYVSAQASIEYEIQFENIPGAEAAAQRVTISDQLPSELDWSTVRVISAEVGGVPIGLSDVLDGEGRPVTVGSANLDPSGRRVLLDATVDVTNGLFTAHFGGPPGLDDPFAPTPYRDFLPPNRTAPEGQGSIRIKAELVSGLETGTSVSNTASITFDDHFGGPTILTPTWTNIIDADAPIAVLGALPASVTDDEVELTWSVSDIGSEFEYAQVFISVDEGAFAVSRFNEPGANVTMTVEGGHIYAFKVRAVDGVGNAGPLSDAVRTSTVPASTTTTTVAATTTTTTVAATTTTTTVPATTTTTTVPATTTTTTTVPATTTTTTVPATTTTTTVPATTTTTTTVPASTTTTVPATTTTTVPASTTTTVPASTTTTICGFLAQTRSRAPLFFSFLAPLEAALGCTNGLPSTTLPPATTTVPPTTTTTTPPRIGDVCAVFAKLRSSFGFLAPLGAAFGCAATTPSLATAGITATPMPSTPTQRSRRSPDLCWLTAAPCWVG
jgi:hypothetical protein